MAFRRSPSAACAIAAATCCGSSSPSRAATARSALASALAVMGLKVMVAVPRESKSARTSWSGERRLISFRMMTYNAGHERASEVVWACIRSAM